MSQNDSSVPEVDRHEEASILLPWYANGTLAPSEHRKVSSHLASCAGCRKALAEFQKVQTLWQHENSAPFDVESGLARLLSTIDQNEHC
ncbi:zf-HC2 domain-containing protein [Methylotetracoccus oryzae]|uniref:zf-HC2 domain-containing protein n=1 Tax=Methylotetracoccus oryzae TaxID=1919059 RepID=UPI00111BB6A1|nr:zf-HC2 domain-containing protein [Methylotetracoccus oryzae]